MRMRIRKRWMVAGLMLSLPYLAYSRAQAERPEWDQGKAVEAVKKVTALEAARRQPWDKIAWLTDVDAAVARARKENRPIFLYFYVEKGGPAAAMC
uniref:Thioredoxin domain-containing protein n=1 Tax=uncultured Armatimonadetes bacterium TaxID=157466 RepID=A0A6J4H5T5_9BACT|nr:hypothetical protein AVDCRST_MAG63-14 [uncultured Armatimonadetes bacterium]